MQNLKGYKSVIFFGLVLAVAIANLYGFGNFAMTKEQQDVFAVVVPLIGLVLRYLTDSEIFKTE